MANSSLIPSLKQAVIRELLKDEALFYAIDSPTVKDPECADELLYTHIFPYHKSHETLTETGTFLTLQMQIPRTYDASNIWVIPRLKIRIISHESHMKVDNVSNISDTRNDYIAKLIDKKLNGRDTLDENTLHLFSRLDLVSNVEGALSKEYLYRQMIFEVKDLNNSFCDSE